MRAWRSMVAAVAAVRCFIGSAARMQVLSKDGHIGMHHDCG